MSVLVGEACIPICSAGRTPAAVSLGRGRSAHSEGMSGSLGAERGVNSNFALQEKISQKS